MIERACDLSDDEARDLDDCSVLGHVVLVFILNNECAAGVVVALILPPLEHNLKPLQLSLVFDNLNNPMVPSEAYSEELLAVSPGK